MIKFPAEWYPQKFVQLTWPHKDTDWAYMLPQAEECFKNIAREIAKRQKLLIVAPDIELVKSQICNDVNMENVEFAQIQTNDTWARDHGGISVLIRNKPTVFDFQFNGWGLKYTANYDNLITEQLAKKGHIDAPLCNYRHFVFEGGSIESDGEGTLLTTSNCLLSPNRNAAMNKQEIEHHLLDAFGAKQLLWLNNGYLAGDDTDSHIDTLARLAPNDTILYVKCDDKKDEHYSALKAMEVELMQMKNLKGKPFNLIPLPMAQKVVVDGERLPATYANYLIINKAVLVPTYNTPLDDIALTTIQQVFSDREVIGIDCSALICQHGSLHCVTMQYI